MAYTMIQGDTGDNAATVRKTFLDHIRRIYGDGYLSMTTLKNVKGVEV